ncbi:MAG: ABC transporter ATP-binding protein [Candidatus Aenigmatarchaeota archaeon]
MSEDDIIIELKDVHKVYQMGETKVRALRGSSLRVERGEFLSIEGPSGSGKSTLMNMIGCLDVPTSGKIHLEEWDIETLHESDLAQIRGKKIGFVFQTFNLIHNLTALENVMLPMMFQEVPKEKRYTRGRDLLKKVGLGKRLHHKPSELSGGQQQRVAIARALANDPDVILADEPTGNLDSKTGKKVLKLLKNLNEKEGKTIIMVTHDPRAAGYAGRVVKIKDGVVNEDQ